MKQYAAFPTASGCDYEHVLPPDHRVSCERCVKRSGFVCIPQRIQVVPFAILHDCERFQLRMGYGSA